MRLKRPRIRLPSVLSSISLDDVLSGHTCEPISLAEFEAYLQYKEHSVENLRFVVWYQSYRRRFFALPKSQQKLSPGSGEFNFGLPTPARNAQHISRVSTRMTALSDEPSSPSSPQSPSSTAPILSRTPSIPTAVSIRQTRTQTTLDPNAQPFRHECTLVASTFLLPSSPFELALPSEILSITLNELALNTHPDVFLPAYEHAYEALLTQSLPRFLNGMHENMNWEKKIYWWLYGFLTSCVGWAIVIGCLFIHYGHHTTEGRLRAWRLLGVPFLTLGSMQMYAGYRGYAQDQLIYRSLTLTYL